MKCENCQLNYDKYALEDGLCISCRDAEKKEAYNNRMSYRREFIEMCGTNRWLEYVRDTVFEDDETYCNPDTDVDTLTDDDEYDDSFISLGDDPWEDDCEEDY